MLFSNTFDSKNGISCSFRFYLQWQLSWVKWFYDCGRAVEEIRLVEEIRAAGYHFLEDLAFKSFSFSFML